MPIRAVFLDAGGVLLDTTIMAPQWQRLLGDFLAPRLGGDPAAWGPANVYAAERMRARYRDPGGTPRETHGRLRRLWLREMCERVGILPPREASAIADEAYAWVSERVTAPMPGVVELARALSGRGVRLFTSTGQPSIEIRARPRVGASGRHADLPVCAEGSAIRARARHFARRRRGADRAGAGLARSTRIVRCGP